LNGAEIPERSESDQYCLSPISKARRPSNVNERTPYPGFSEVAIDSISSALFIAAA